MRETIKVHEELQLSYVGLTELEVRVLKSIFTLAPQLNENVTLTSPEQVEQADIILVNADQPESLNLWKNLKQRNNLCSSLMLTDDQETADGDFVLQRPIRVQKLISAIENIVEQTSIKFPSSSGEPELRVLVVDDSFPVRKYMEHKLGELIDVPIQLHLVSSGEEAIAKVASVACDIIFLDVMMDGVDGYKVCKTIKSQQNPYIVMLTSKKSPFDKVRGTMSGCDAYITKPPADERLVEEIRKCLDRLGRNVSRLAVADAR
ncbi:MAG TPA: response regulator [Gammaproteobacteria bacterium]|jgi:twitching motility two-component system response regulator PilG